MRAMCLIPTTRPDSVEEMKLDLINDGWECRIYHDTSRFGANYSRQVMLRHALQLGVDAIRFADDDDRLLPHREEALHALQDADVVYFNYALWRYGQNIQSIRLSGDPVWDVPFAHPWLWVARAEALDYLNSKEPFWDVNAQVMHGPYAFLKFMHAGLRIKFHPKPCYIWRQGLDGVSVLPSNPEAYVQFLHHYLENP